MYIILLVLWIILNGRCTPELLAVGAVVAGVLFAACCRFLHYSIARDIWIWKRIPLVLLYVARLIREIAEAAVQVLRLVFSPKYEPEPAIVEFDMNFRTEVGQALLANYITLTPGTITVDVSRNHFRVHCLDVSFAPDTENWPMARLIERMEEN